MNPVDVTGHSSPDGGTADDVAFSVAEGCDADDVVFAVLALALNRTAGVAHAPADATITETKVPLLIDLRPFPLAVFIFPDF